MHSSSNVKVSCDQAANIDRANLHYIEISYLRYLRLNGPSLNFTLQSPNAAITGANGDTRVWDVSDPRSYYAAQPAIRRRPRPLVLSIGHAWKRYVAWKSAEGLPQPEIIGYAANQNLHGLPTPDMVIFTLPQWYKEAASGGTPQADARTGCRVTTWMTFITNSAPVHLTYKHAQDAQDVLRTSREKLKYALVMDDPRGTTSQS